MMDDPALAWPAWKFGLKPVELFTTLAQRYNTFASPIQDPESFHHDVWEIANEASSTEEFHRLLAERKERRLKQLHASLHAAACELIGNPKLLGDDRWAYAVNLFRTRSLDSMIQYFWSYIPSDQVSNLAPSYSSFDDCMSTKTASTQATSVNDTDHLTSFLRDHDRGELMDEPLHIRTDGLQYTSSSSLPDYGSLDDSCPSLFDDASDTTASSPTSIEVISLSGSEGEHFAPEQYSHKFSHKKSSPLSEDEGAVYSSNLTTKMSDDGHCPTLEDNASGQENPHHLRRLDDRRGVDDNADAAYVNPDAPPTHVPIHPLAASCEYDDGEELPCAQFPDDGLASLDSETPTPKQSIPVGADLNSYVSHKPTTTPNKHNETSSFNVSIHRCASPTRRNKSPPYGRGRSPLQGIRRGPEESLNRVQKPLPDPIRRPMVSRKSKLQ